MTDDYAEEARAAEDFEAVLDDLTTAQLTFLATCTAPCMSDTERLEIVCVAIVGMSRKDKLQLVMEHTPGQYAICVRDANQDLRVEGIPPRGQCNA